LFEQFVAVNSYVSGNYDRGEDFKRLNAEIQRYEKNGKANRLFYLALPPTVYKDATKNIHDYCQGNR